jgi:D-glycero-beta-D-manno-heptose 1-phosphate adenylyltransferase
MDETRSLLRKFKPLAKSAAMNDAARVLTFDELPAWRDGLRQARRKLVVTNGCFDLLHLGHVTYLRTARELGDALLVGVNSDASVRVLKGEGRPLNSEQDRALVLAALRCVDAVCVFPEVRAVRLLSAAQPDIYVKGGDYTLDTLDQGERRAVESLGGQIEIIPFVPGKSTTGLIERITHAAG